MRLHKTKRKYGCAIDITPLIDVVFLLIIFSMAVSQFSRLQAEDLRLPEAREGTRPIASLAGRLVINIRPDGSLGVLGADHTLDTLAALLADRVRTRGAGALSVIVRSDRRTPWGFVRPVLKECAAAGIADVNVAVLDPGATGGGGTP